MANRIKDFLYKNKTNEEFTYLNLPRKRKDVFLRLFRFSFSKLLLLSLFCSIFFLFSFTWRILFDTYLLRLDIESEDYFNTYFTLTVYYSTPVRLVLNIISFIGLSGLIYSIRILCWGMPYKLTHTFFRGVKLSFKEYFISSIVYTIVSTIYDLVFKYLSLNLYDSIIINILLYSLLIISAVIVGTMFIYSLTMSSLYQMRSINKLKYSFILSIKYYFKNLGIIAISLLIFIVPFLIRNVLFELVSIGLLILIGFSYVSLIIVLYTNSIYDKHININDYKDYYRKGLSIE